MQFTFQLGDPDLSVMEYNYLKTHGQNMTFTQFLPECISMFGSHMEAWKVKPVMNIISTSEVSMKQKNHSQKRNNQKKRKIQAQIG